MQRRSFFRMVIGGVAMSAAVRTWPFRVFSFPKRITVSSFGVSDFSVPAGEGLPSKILKSYVRTEDIPGSYGFEFDEEINVNVLYHSPSLFAESR